MKNLVPFNKAAAWAWVFAVALAADVPGFADDEGKTTPSGSQSQAYNPPVAPASDEGLRAMRSFRVPAELNVELFAAEPHLANPVSFCIDEKGVFYVAETFRHGAGVTDTRGHMNWLDDDLACRSVADRVAMYKKFLGKEFAGYNLQHERVRRIVDRDGDGKADAATIFADGFNDPAAGIGAGVLARKDNVWFTCIPWLWKLRDTNGDGRADDRILLHEGYGIHVGFLGHDLHGLRFGPDGRLYFSIGDRGFNVTTREGQRLTVPDTGSVLRCNPDGTELEVFATGLRNPQELAFDEYGNLFTGDNNSDSGDRARWVYVVEGGDSGWRIGYQFIEAPISRGPWNEERLWYPPFAGQAAYIIPPIANIADGPSGLTYDPGVTLLPAQFKNHFFLVDFRGSSGQSGIRTFSLQPKGASFQLVNPRQFVWSVLATDADFGPDGALYFCDWVEGWEKTNKGRIYRVMDRARRDLPQVLEVKTLLAQGMEGRPVDALSGLLAHADMRVRQEAQFELAGRGDEGWRILAQIAGSSGQTLPRIHAIWGLGQAARTSRAGRSDALWDAIGGLLADPDPEVRAQTAKLVGDAALTKSLNRLIALLEDSSPRVRFFAAAALGRLGRSEAVEPLLRMVRANGGNDPYLRHAGVIGLVGSGKTEAWSQAARDQSPQARMAILLAMRRREDPEIALFLSDADPLIVLEAARAIHDVPIPAALSSLAKLAIASTAPVPLLRRVLNANFRLGQPENAAVLAEVAARSELPEAARVLALEMLASWATPSGRDRVLGLWRPIPPRSPGLGIDALRPRLAAILASGPANVRTAAAAAAGTMGIKEVGARLAALVTDRGLADKTRAEALKALDQLDYPRRIEPAQQALVMPGYRSRTEALRILAKVDPGTALKPLRDRLEHGSTAERQGAMAVLAAMPGEPARDELSGWVDRLIAGKVATEIQLDVIEAAKKRPETDFQQKIDRYESSKPKDDMLAPYREVLTGGDAQRGMTVFTTKAELECVRCHKVRDSSGEPVGGEVGPELSGIGNRQTRAYLLESIVDPNKQIAQGFESVVLATNDGQVHTGVLRGEDDKEVRLIMADGKPDVVRKELIEERKRGPSAMPNDLARKLSRAELRDMIEFLANLKGK
ncbi:MAG TPA: PVC-type heme-binding CxxCH protein [Isosphaeraceae bacterium]|nr:PVC-type heme-binding CxxCH protein [Isosphaeraceae bacterium]